MISYDTILSAFDDRETLLKWLKKVEQTLAESTLTGVDCKNIDDSHIKFTFIFADGTKIETPNVYVKSGLDGKDGQDGADGVGFNTLAEADIPASVASVLYSAASGASITGTASFKTADKTYTVTSKTLLPISGTGAVGVDASENAKQINISLDGYAGAAVGQYPRKTASGLEWVAGTGGGAMVETGNFSAPIYQANLGQSFSSWEAITGKTVNASYSFIGDILIVRLEGFGAIASIAQSKTFYVGLNSLLETFSIPLTVRNMYIGTLPSYAGTTSNAYPFTYCEGSESTATAFAVQFQKSMGYGTSTNAFTTSATFNFQCPALCFTINSVSKK